MCTDCVHVNCRELGLEMFVAHFERGTAAFYPLVLLSDEDKLIRHLELSLPAPNSSDAKVL